MPKKVVKNKNKMNIGIAIFTVIFMAIPVLITLFTGVSSFKNPYGIYILSVLGICVYFSCIFGMFSWKNKILYIVMDIINVVVSLGFVVYAYINYSYKGGLLLHIASALLFTYGMYQMSDSEQGDCFFYRYFAPVAIDIAGLIFVLWFINVKMNVIAHIVIVSIINFFTLAFFLIPSIVKLFKMSDQAFDGIQNDEVETEEETEEEKSIKQAEKMAKIDAKKNQQVSFANPQNSTSSNHSGAYNSRRYCIDRRVLRDISSHLTDQFNRAVNHSNADIRDNNSTIRNSYEERYVRLAIQSNKEIKRSIRYLRNSLNSANKYLEKLGKVVFTAEDQCKSFTFDLRNGKLKKLKNETNISNPSVRIMNYYARSSYITNYNSTKTVEITYDGLNDFAIEIK